MDLGLETLSKITIFSKYARYLPELKRRETWEEIVDRYQTMLIKKYPLLEESIKHHGRFIREKKELPSMRSLQFAGLAAEVNNTRTYNCAYCPIDSIYSFSEIMFLLLGGTGCGFSVQKHHVDMLPPVYKSNKKKRNWLVEDSIMGWADAIKVLMKCYLNGGFKPVFDFRAIRPKGAKLITAGGKAPGPEPLKICIAHIEAILERKNDGEKLTPLECHDIVCHIANSVLAGGIRRCLPEGAMVHTDSGLIEIEHIQVGDRVLTFNGYKEVKNILDQGIQDTIKILTQTGYFECTPNHRVAILTDLGKYEWKEAGSLQKDDRMIFSTESIGGDSNLPNFVYEKPKMSTTCKDINIPELTTEIAYLFGQIAGDGYVHISKEKKKNGTVNRRGRVSIACSDNYPEVVEKVVKAFSKFGVRAVIKKGDGKLKNVIVHSYQLALYMSQWKLPNQEIIVPEFILRGHENIKGAYLAGLFDSDGCASNRPVRLLNSVYPKFTKQIQNLYSSIGIITKFSYMERKEKNWKAMTQLALVGKSAYDGFMNYVQPFATKKIKTDNKHGHYSYTLPSKFLPIGIKGNSDRSMEVVNRHLNTLTTYLPVKVIGIDKGRSVNTFDIEVEERNEFICEGYLVHNSACISLFSIDDEEMLTCKYGNWYETNEQRGRCNNSVVLERGKVTQEQFFNIWKRIEASGSGEPGLYWTFDRDIGCNPCCEISLRPYSFCNLSEVNVNDVEDQYDFEERVCAAAFFGTLQAGFTDFHYLRPIWKKTTEEDALIGVSLTGIGSGKVLHLDIASAASKVKIINADVADIIGINKAARACCIKPAGTTSAVLGTSSGIHAWHSKYYLRTMRFNKNEDIALYLMYNHPELCEDDILRPADTVCVRIPIKAPEGAILRDEPVDHLLNRIKRFYREWILIGHVRGANTHNISATISVKENEWEKVGTWLWNNQDYYNGISVLPYSNHTYKQAPFEEITEKEYYDRVSLLKNIDLRNVIELDDIVDFGQTTACAGGSCELHI